MTVYTVRQPLRHDGVTYGIGSEVVFGDAAAKRLLAAGVIAAAAGTARDGLDAIVDAILELGPEDAESWTADGKPQVRAVEAILGYDITAGQRDAAWSRMQNELAADGAGS